MSWTNRVIWQEGMFLRAQHFQQQDRWLEALVRGRTGMLRPYPWGITEYAIDRDLLATGRFALSSGAGVFEDGTLFVIPGETDHPPPLEPPQTARNVLVYLAPRSASPVRPRSGWRRTARDATDQRASKPTTPTPVPRSPRTFRSAGSGCDTCWRRRIEPVITALA